VTQSKHSNAAPHHWLTLAAAVFWITAVSALATLAGGEGEPRHGKQAAADALFTNGALRVLKIVIPESGLSSLRQTPRTYVPATLHEGSNALINVRIRLKGGFGSFRQLDDKPGFTLNLAEASDTFHGLKKFHLNNSVQDPTFLSEWLSSEIFRESGVPAARVAHAMVELNGRRLGLYLVLESINSEFFARYFKLTGGNLYSRSPNADITEPLERMGGNEATTWRELQALAAAAAEPDLDRLRVRLPQTVDLPRFLSLMAVDVVLDNWDGYTMNIKNYEVYHDLDTDRVVFMPHDLDQLFRNNSAPVIPAAHGVVARAVLREPQFRAAYRQRLNEVVTNFFLAPVLLERIESRVAKLTSELKDYDPGLAAELARQSGALKDRIVARSKYLAAQLAVEEANRLASTNRSVPATAPVAPAK
jgi:hypothetical protein